MTVFIPSDQRWGRERPDAGVAKGINCAECPSGTRRVFSIELMQNKTKKPAERTTWLVLAAIVFASILRVIREWLTLDRSLIETFSRWEWALNFLLYWLLTSIAIAVVFLGIDAIRKRAEHKD